MYVDSALSDWLLVISDVPKERILGLILLKFCKNDLPSDVTAKLLLFADNTNLIKMLLSIKSTSVWKMAIKM